MMSGVAKRKETRREMAMICCWVENDWRCLVGLRVDVQARRECAADVGEEIRRDDREKEVSMSMGSTMGEAKGSPAYDAR